MNVCVRVCVCAGWVGGGKEGEFTSRAKEQWMHVDSCTSLRPLRSASHLLVYFLFVSRLDEMGLSHFRGPCVNKQFPARQTDSLISFAATFAQKHDTGRI